MRSFNFLVAAVWVSVSALVITACEGLVIPLKAATPAQSLQGIELQKLGSDETIDLGESLLATKAKTLLVAASHPADFNTIEYGQQVRHYHEQLSKKGIDRCVMIMNGSPSSCSKLKSLLDLPDKVEIYPDPEGRAGRSLGVSRGFQPDNESIPTALKVTVVGLGFGPPWGTLGAVLPGYFGNPNGHREWIEAALQQGQLSGRWPEVLELDDEGNILGNKFDNFPGLSSWGRRPFELATLRLQNILDIQIKHWNELKPVDDRCLAQLGGCMIVGEGGKPVYSWVDRGLCDVPDFKDIVEMI